MKEFTLSVGAQKDLKIDYQKELNAEQLEVVLHGDGPCLVLAGAGSGKTRTITYRVAYLLESGVSSENILLLTFTNKAANEMMTRVADLLGSPAQGLVGGTFHSIANRFLRHYASLIGFTPSFTILDQEDSQDLVKLCIKNLNVDTKARRFPSPAVVHSILSYARNASMSVADAIKKKHPHFLDLTGIIEGINNLYVERKRLSNAMDFDDLLLKLLELLESHESVRSSLAECFHYVLVDEYQDTNKVQARIVELLCSHHRNILVVGDDAQSIYSFRAAEIRNILSFSDRYTDAKLFRLETNYRSTPEVLSLANAVIAQNVGQYEKNLRTHHASFEKPNLIPASDNRQEAQYIAEQILKLRDDGTELGNIAVLFRAAYHSQALEMELARRDIPYEYRGGMKFFERAHVKDVIAYLRLVTNPKDVMAWIRVLSHQPGIGAVTANHIAEAVQKAENLEQALALGSEVAVGRAEAGWRGCAGILSRMLKVHQAPTDLINAIASSSYRDYLEAEYPNFMDRLEDVEQFAIFATAYTDLTTFLQEVTLNDNHVATGEESSVDEEKIILSTIHQAKGLEWDAVFIINLSDGAFPHPRALDEEGGIEEERRLFYVAVTRSRKHLFLTYPITAGYETLEPRQPSMFLDELPKGLVDEVRLKRHLLRVDFEEPMIILDSTGEPQKQAKRISFLRDVDEL
ncbi:MAG: ATP-dependent helicase [Patescibacteria group bacterium]